MNAETLFTHSDAPDALSSWRAKELREFLAQGRHSFASLIGCAAQPPSLQLGEPHEFVLVEVRPHIPQIKLKDIRSVERFAIGFGASDSRPPWVFTLRDDFPHVLHTNTHKGWPLSLCLSDEPWPEACLHWTPSTFIEDLRGWLRRTAIDGNHAIDQQLEFAFLEWHGDLILPSDFIERFPADGSTLRVSQVHDGPLPTYSAVWGASVVGPDVVCLAFSAKPHVHQPVAARPNTLKELAALLDTHGAGLYATLREALPTKVPEALREKPLMLLLLLPMQRHASGEVELQQVVAAVTERSIREVGEAVGAWILTPDRKYGIPFGMMELDGQPEVPVQVLNPHFKITRKAAAWFSGREPRGVKVCAVGVGALGSQVTELLASSGFGNWTLIDHDKLMPHNVVRHALGDTEIGKPKVRPMSALIGAMFGDDVRMIEASVGAQGPQAVDVTKALGEANLILDFSASVATARFLAIDEPSNVRRASFFLTPDGTSSVLLAEDSSRTLPLDALEMQYYRAACTNPLLADHFNRPVEKVNFSRTCRDTTFQIPNELVSLHASIGAHAVHRFAQHGSAVIRVWQTDPETGDTRSLTVPTTSVTTGTVNGWWLSVDQHVVERMNQLRSPKLPRETGGVLI